MHRGGIDLAEAYINGTIVSAIRGWAAKGSLVEPSKPAFFALQSPEKSISVKFARLSFGCWLNVTMNPKGSMKNRIFAASLAVFLFFACWSTAYAYIDAGTGSMILQLLLGGVAGALVLGKLYWHRLKGLFQFGRRDAEDSDS